MIIEDTQEAGLLETDQSIYLQNIFELTDKTVPRVHDPARKDGRHRNQHAVCQSP